MALDVLAKGGLARRSMNNLIKVSSVTNGSLYWHFKSQADFHNALVDYWHDMHALTIARATDEFTSDAAAKLYFLADYIIAENHAQLDNIMTLLAIKNNKLMPIVNTSYEYRQDYIHKQFSTMGHKGEELRCRSTLFVSF
jgi:AcrR family transcriptional regulator